MLVKAPLEAILFIDDTLSLYSWHMFSGRFYFYSIYIYIYIIIVNDHNVLMTTGLALFPYILYPTNHVSINSYFILQKLCLRHAYKKQYV